MRRLKGYLALALAWLLDFTARSNWLPYGLVVFAQDCLDAEGVMGTVSDKGHTLAYEVTVERIREDYFGEVHG